MEIFEYSNKGTRKQNQDFILHHSVADQAHLFVVADGMGGYAAGDIAAKSVTEAMCEYVQAHLHQHPAVQVLHDAVIFANDELAFRRYSYGGVQMGAVIVAMLLIDHTAYVTWLGDSRLYYYRDGSLCFQTEDHSMLNQLRKIRFLKPEEINRYAAVVTQSVMGDDKLGQVEVKTISVDSGDVLFLCSDGLHKVIEPANLPQAESDLRTYLNDNSDNFDDNYSLIRVII